MNNRLYIANEGAINNRISELPPGYELYPDVVITTLSPYTSAGYTTLPLWDHGTYNQGIEIPPGSWELHVSFEWTAGQGMYAIAISVKVTGVPSAYTLQIKSDRYEASGSFTDRLDFNMGTFPSGTVTVDHVKAHSTNFYTTGYPPQDEW